MALPENTEPSDKKPTEVHKGLDKKEKLLTKVIVRRLPPNMDQETFLNQISPIPNYDYFYMVKGDASLGENSFSRAYINFTNPNDIYDFKEKFDNYVFLDNAGHEYPAVVEFAAFQKIPKRRNKVRVDPKVGTIESDPYFLEFVELINKPPEHDEKPEYTYQLATENKNIKNESMTPLLEYVKNRRAEKMRIREERREERKRKEFEKKKFREDERRRRFEERSPVKNKSQYTKVVSPKEKSMDVKDIEKDETEKEPKAAEDKIQEKQSNEKYEKPPTSYYKVRDKKYDKYDDRRKDLKSNKYPKKEYPEKREFKRKDDYKERDYRSKYDDYKKEEPKLYQKKVKKYSEKREERKMEAQKAEQKKLEQQQEVPSKSEDNVKQNVEDKATENTHKKVEETKETVETISESTVKTTENQNKATESEVQAMRRIRNKDRPTIAIYRPGMLSKRKQGDGGNDQRAETKEE